MKRQRFNENWDLTTIPDEELYAESGRRARQQRKAIGGGGRPKVLKPCPYCGLEFSARELITHKRDVHGRASRS